MKKKSETKSRRLHLRVVPSLRARVEEVAEAKGQSLNTFIGRAIQAAISEYEARNG